MSNTTYLTIDSHVLSLLSQEIGCAIENGIRAGFEEVRKAEALAREGGAPGTRTLPHACDLLKRFAESQEAWKAEPGTIDHEVWQFIKERGL